jgi:hypothetical protein
MKLNQFEFIVILFFTLLTSKSFSQDIITTKSGEDIKAKVLEVTTEEVKYKKTDNINSPVFTSLKSEILIIRYENGTKDIFDADASTNKIILTSGNSEQKKEEIIKKEENLKKEENNSKSNNKTSFGLKGGLNVSSYTSPSASYRLDPLLSFNIAAFIEFNFKSKFAFQPEIQYSRQGTKYARKYPIYLSAFDPLLQQTFAFDNNGKIELDYINVPLLLKYNISDSFGIYSGPQLSLLINGEEKYVFYSNRIPFAGCFGINYNIGKVMFDLRYFISSKIGTQTYYFSLLDSNNSVFQLAFGYRLN